ncbi:hypothetical protein D3C78_1821220 [compost metagenome]
MQEGLEPRMLMRVQAGQHGHDDRVGVVERVPVTFAYLGQAVTLFNTQDFPRQQNGLALQCVEMLV